MGLGDLLFGKRKQFNRDVGYMLRENLKIETNSSMNPHFPGILFYMHLLDEGWRKKVSAEEMALDIAVGLFLGLRNKNLFNTPEDMRAMQNYIIEFVRHNYNSGRIRKMFVPAVEKDIGVIIIPS